MDIAFHLGGKQKMERSRGYGTRRADIRQPVGDFTDFSFWALRKDPYFCFRANVLYLVLKKTLTGSTRAALRFPLLFARLRHALSKRFLLEKAYHTYLPIRAFSPSLMGFVRSVASSAAQRR